MLELKNISLNFKEFSLREISFSVEQGEYFVLLGKSGAGKSLILEIIAGMLKPGSGKVFLSGKDITEERIQKREVAIVFQDYAVFPHLSVKENICYPLRAKNVNKHEQDKRAKELAERLGIGHLLNRRTTTLSGGELQRVALARALATDPKCILLDEPLSSLDVQLQHDLRTMLRKLNKDGLTIIHVTHNYEEAVSLASRVGIIDSGTLEQTGTLKEVFHSPKSLYIANLTGIKNFYNAEITGKGKAILEQKKEIHLPAAEKGKTGFALFRAEDVVISCEALVSSFTNNFKGKILHISPSITGVEVLLDAGIRLTALITEQSVEKLELKEGKEVYVNFKASAVRFIDTAV
ncbi:MAG: ABC transporter ATP-binding protein [Chlorobi bacterium]|nr:ABC transporter ATP-binding protein [Chlorobiota bacterium]